MSTLRNIRSSIVRYLVSWKLLKKEKALIYNDFELSFSDDFDGRRLDTNKWMTHYYWGNSHSDNEHQFYSAEAFTLKNSVLTINVENRKIRGWWMKDGKRATKIFDVTSGLIHTGESFKQRYGRFEVRCRVPQEKGYIPSFWLINPQSFPPEIDVMDFSEGANDTLCIGHAYGDDEVDDLFFRIKKVIGNLKLDSDWNIFTLDWTPTSLTWYVNGREIYRVGSTGVPHTPMYIAINMAIGEEAVKVNTKKMEIDWVRVYKLSK